MLKIKNLNIQLEQKALLQLAELINLNKKYISTDKNNKYISHFPNITFLSRKH